MSQKTITERATEALAYAEQLANTGHYNWVEANNALFGPGGQITTLFPTREDRIAFSLLSPARKYTNITSFKVNHKHR